MRFYVFVIGISEVPSAGICVGPAVCMYWVEWDGSGRDGMEWDGDREGLEGVVWYGMVWGVVWYGMVWYGVVWYGMVWYGMVCQGVPSAKACQGPRRVWQDRQQGGTCTATSERTQAITAGERASKHGGWWERGLGQGLSAFLGMFD